ncbi:MAG TPA: hypothetical protein VMG12_43575 [Polyangiaceae bacterium]|nr:hypothetical protein [Polyangiaceae bacterium]
MTVLARVTNDVDEPRGPDVLLNVEVPMEWLEEGASISIALPRLLFCARCEGGGCDLCGRKGAFEAAAEGPVVVSLPRQAGGAAPSALRLRLPGYGARGDAELPLGHLILTVLPRDAAFGWAPASHVQKVVTSDSPRRPTHWATGAWGVAIAVCALIAWWLSR